MLFISLTVNLGQGFGYVSFADEDSIDLGMNMDKLELKGKELRVERCHRKTKPKKKATKDTPAAKRKISL